MNSEMQYGNYMLTSENESEILRLNVQILKSHYTERFTENPELSLARVLEKYPKNRISGIFRNFD